MAYAAETEVSVERTRAEIERMLERFGATAQAVMQEQARAVVVFEARDLRIRFNLPLPSTVDAATTETGRVRSANAVAAKLVQMRRSRWRALMLVIKAKIEAVESEIETFEESFLSHVVMGDGRTVGEHTIPAIQTSYRTGALVPLLPAPRQGG